MTGNSNGRSQELRELQAQNAALRKQVEDLTAERDCYLRAVHARAKEKITEERVASWMAEEKIEGSLLDFINETPN